MSDLTLRPTNPVSAYFDIDASSPRGKAFLNSLYPNRRYIQSNRDLRYFKERAAARGIEFKFDWSMVLSIKEAAE